MKTKYYVVRTAFHGGGIVSAHRKLERAEAAARRVHKHITCVCGCVGVVTAEEYETLPLAHQDGVYYHNLARR